MALWACLFVVALAPLPLGSARPLAWGLWGIFLSAVLTIYAALMGRSQQALRVGVREIQLPALLFFLTIAWLIVQLLPLALLFGGFDITGTFGSVATGERISIDSRSTLLMLIRQLSYGTLFFLTLQAVAHEKRRELAINAILISCIAYGLLGVVALQSGDWILGMEKWAYSGSATGPFVNRNSFATYLALGGVVAAAQLARHVADRLERHHDDGPIPHNASSILLYAMALLFLMAVIFASQSRMGLAAAGVGSATVFVAMSFRSMRALPIAIAGIGCILILGFVASMLFGEGIFDRFQNVENDADVRIALYQQVLQLIQLRPWTGFGGGTFELAFPLVHQMPVNVDLVWDKAHNTYLTLWSELGIIGGSLPMLATAVIGWRSATYPRGEVDWRSRSITLGAIAVAAVHSLADFSLEIQANALLFVALLAIGLPFRTKKPSR
jgi:O-antigen ligase